MTNRLETRCHDSPAPERRRRRRSSRLRAARLRLLAALAVLASTFALLYVTASREFGSPSALRTLQEAELRSPPISGRPGSTKRVVYRHSVIPGGAYDRGELAVAIATDPIVAEHYRDFDVTTTHVVRVAQPRAVHVSYRIGNAVYWTKNKVWLQPGETLLTDGTQEARGRCGNRVAEVIPGPVTTEEPPLEALDQPLAAEPVGITPLRGFDLMFADLPAELPVRDLAFDPTPDPLVSTPVSLVPSAPVLFFEESSPAIPGEVPEPGTLLLLGSGALALARQVRRRRRH